MKKYYIEIWHNDEEFELPYVLQSKWYNTEKQALEWATSIDYLDKDFNIALMSSEWEITSNCPIDIKMEHWIKHGEALKKDIIYNKKLKGEN